MRALLAFATFSIACAVPPRAQVIFYVDTDAPIGTFGRNIADPIPLFDRVRVELLPPGSDLPCDRCTNEFAVTTEQFANQTVSIGIESASPGYRLRVRLFRGLFAHEGEPDAPTTIDATFVVPVAAPDTIIEASGLLETAQIGVPATALATTPGKPSMSRVGTWPGALRAPCKGTLKGDEACVPGGAFWMGAAPGPATETTDWHRLAVISPFIVKTNEVTVAEVRNAGTHATGQWSGSSAGTAIADFGTGSVGEPLSYGRVLRETVPVNCITWVDASDYCARTGGTLPTEAQLAYLGTGLRGFPFVWGTDPPSCTDAIWGRAGFGLLLGSRPDACRDPSKNHLGELGGPEPAGGGALDRIVVGDRTIFDIAGNVSEWARDRWQERSGDCWTDPLLIDPFCDHPTDVKRFDFVITGGSWGIGIESLLAWSRTGFYGLTVSPAWGFRCVRPSD